MFGRKPNPNYELVHDIAYHHCENYNHQGNSKFLDFKVKSSNDDFIVFCESGLKQLESLQVNPGLIVGDFDSHDNPHLGVKTIVLPCEKDDTDTVFAVKEAIKRGFDDFLLIGVVGARLDHTLGNRAFCILIPFYRTNREQLHHLGEWFF